MKFLDLKFIKQNQEFIISEMKSGKIFIYPTDTVYGIGCDATNSNSVQRIFEIKKRKNKPLLIIAPNLKWIFKNCEIEPRHINLIKKKLPGAYSFVIKLKNKFIISKKVLAGKDTIGIRIPKCYFSEFVEKARVPFITTSVNFSSEKTTVRIENIPEEILKKVDYVLEQDNDLLGTSSSIYDISSDDIKILR